MNQNSAKVEKTGRIILVAVRIVQAVLIVSIGMSILSYILPDGVFAPRIDKQGSYFYTILLNTIITAVVLAVLFIASGMLKSLKSGYTPFTKVNVKRLKVISILLIAIEPIQMIFGGIFNALRPLTASGEKIVSVTSMGGMVIVLGLIVFCIALVFEYGIELQTQSDETL